MHGNEPSREHTIVVELPNGRVNTSVITNMWEVCFDVVPLHVFSVFKRPYRIKVLIINFIFPYVSDMPFLERELI